MSKSTYPLSLPVRRALAGLGADIRTARLRRRLPAEVVAQRARITRVTLRRVERGDPSTSLGAYAMTLFALGLADRLQGLAHPGRDEVGLSLSEEQLPVRVRLSRRRPPSMPPRNGA